MSKRIKKPAAIAMIAAAALTVSVTAGAAAYEMLFHKESIDIHLGEGAADAITSSVELNSVTTENEYFRITADAVFSDGSTVMIYMTKERLTDPYLGWYHNADHDTWTDFIFINAAYEDGTRIDEQSGYTNVTEVHDEYGWRAFIEPSEDGMSYEVVELNDIEEGRPIMLTFYDATHTGPDDIDYVEGLSLTIDPTQNFSPVTFAAEDGREVCLTPYRVDTHDYFLSKKLWLGELTLKNSETGEQKSFTLKNGHASTPTNNFDGFNFDGFYGGYNFNELIPDVEQYDILEINKYDGEGSLILYRQ